MRWWAWLLALALVPAVLALVNAAVLRLSIWCWWRARGRDVLLVYSDSPYWRNYVEENFLPRLGERAVVLNWSQRKTWRWSLARWAFYHFGGDREFNPLAVVFRPLRRTLVFRFWRPFRERQLGRADLLQQMEREFFGAIGVSNKLDT